MDLYMLEFPTTNNRKEKMMYLILKETSFDNIDSIYDICNFTTDMDKANDMLQGYKLVEKNKNVSYTILKYEKPLVLTEEVA
ncbi:hypothetical protein OAY99_00315 [bacterium]|nr:hypothetical protein [bacterium]